VGCIVSGGRGAKRARVSHRKRPRAAANKTGATRPSQPHGAPTVDSHVATTPPWRRMRTSRSQRGSTFLGVSPKKGRRWNPADRKSTRLNSSHVKISYAVFCLKKKKVLEHVHRGGARGVARRG